MFPLFGSLQQKIGSSLIQMARSKILWQLARVFSMIIVGLFWVVSLVIWVRSWFLRQSLHALFLLWNMLLGLIAVVCSHIYRESNCCTDLLAAHGHSLVGSVWLDLMTSKLSIDFFMDRNGLPNFRFPWNFFKRFFSLPISPPKQHYWQNGS